MPRVFFFVIFVTAVILIFGLLQVFLLSKLNRVWWQRRWIRRAAWSLPLLGVGFFLLYAVGEYHQIAWLIHLGSVVSALALVLEIGLMFALPISGALNGINRLLDRRKKRSSPPVIPDDSRRLFLKTAAAAAPLLAVATGTGGVGRAFADVIVERRPMPIPGLPQAIQNLRILHLSDIHLRQYVTLDTVEQIVTDAAALSPDLVLLTGDIADDLTQLPGAIELVRSLQAPLGAFAILGNHEYFRGIERVRDIYAASPIPLLINESTSLVVGGTRIFLGGLDDPVSLRHLSPDFYVRALDTTLAERQDEDFTILMSHRPNVFPLAAERGVHLTLAGHTHGGQIGWWRRSFLEGAFPEKFLWGEYSLGDARLYTSCGAGHWFPFRLGCPAEAPVIELTRA